MKKLLVFLVSMALILAACLIFSLPLMASADAYQVVNIDGTTTNPAGITPVWNWLTLNWAIIALIVSESAALLPTQYNGIIQAVVRMFSALFEKK